MDFVLQEEANKNGMSFSTEKGVSSALAKEKAKQIVVATKNPEMDVDEVAESIQFSGTDDPYRKSLRETEVGQLTDTKSSLLNEYAATKREDDFVNTSMVDPGVVATPEGINIEKAYADTMIDIAKVLTPKAEYDAEDGQGKIEEALERMEEATRTEALDITFARDKLVELEELDTGNPIGDVLDFAQQMIPTRAGALVSSEVEGYSPDSASELLTSGRNIEGQIKFIKAIKDPVERKRVFNETVDEIATSSLDTAQIFAQAYIGFTQTESFTETMFNEGFDILSIGSFPFRAAGRGLKKAAKYTGLHSSAEYHNSILRGMSKKDPVRGIAEETVDTTAASAVSIARNASEELTPEARVMGELYDTAFTVWNPERANAGGNLTGGARARLSEHLQNSASEASAFLKSVNTSVTRNAPVELQMAVEAEFKQIRKDYTGHGVMDIVEEPVFSPQTDSYVIRGFIGRKDGSVFDTQEAATKYAETWIAEKGAYEVTPQGKGWVISIERDLPELTGLKEALQKGLFDPANSYKDTAPNLILGWLRNNADLEGAGVNSARLTGIHGAQGLYRTFSSIAEPYFQLKNSRWKTEEYQPLVRYLHHYQKKPGAQSKWPANFGEFEDTFFELNGARPTLDQSMAFWAYRQASDFEKVLADTARHASAVRVGGRKVSFDLKGKNGATKVEGTIRNLGNEEFIDKMNTRSNVLFVKADGSHRFISNSERGTFAGELVESLRNSDTQAMQALEKNGLKVGDKRVHYIVTERDFKVDRLTSRDTGTGFAGGGHAINEYPNFVKIPQVEDGIYVGDISVLNAKSIKHANQQAEVLNRAIRAYRNDDDAWRTIIARELGEMTPDDFEDLMAKVPVGFEGNNAAVGVRAGSAASDAMKFPENVFIPRDEGLDLLGDYERRFAKEREGTDLKILEEENGTLYRQDAPLLDPGESLQVGANVAVTARFQKNAAVRALGTWSNQFAGLTSRTVDDIMTNPMEFLHDPKYLPSVKADRTREWVKAENYRRSILRMVETGTPVSRLVNFVNQKMIDQFPSLGKKNEVVPLHKLFTVRDPILFARSLTYNLTMGLYAVDQIAVQSVSAFNLASKSPKYFMQASTAGVALRAAMFSTRPNILKHYGRTYQKFTGMSADEFLEMAQAMRDRGWGEMGGSQTMLDDVTYSNIEAGGIAGNLAAGRPGKALSAVIDKGRFIPENIDRHHRLAGWAAAWMEKRAALGRTKFSRSEIDEIFHRADFLSDNMSAAQNAGWQRGITALPTQFITYPVRVMEQTFPALVFSPNARMTRGEAARLLTLQTALFGATAGGIGTAIGPVWSVDQSLKKYFDEKGIDISEGWMKVLFDGIPSAIVKEVAGWDTDLSTRLSIGGNTGFVQELMTGNQSFFENAIGPSWNTFEKLGGSIKGTGLRAYTNFVYGEEDESYIPVHKDDWVEFLRTIKTFDLGFRAQGIIAANKWTSRTGEELTDIGTEEGLLTMLSGGSPREVTQMWLRRATVADRNASVATVNNQIKDFYSKALKSDDVDTQRAYFAQMDIWRKAFGVDPVRFNRIMVGAVNELGDGNAVQRVEKAFQEFQRRKEAGYE